MDIPWEEIEGALGVALEGPEELKSFREEVFGRLVQKERELASEAWRRTFRRELPYYRLLTPHQRDHFRQIFGHVLPDPDVPVESFDREERVLLDMLAERYVRNALLFADRMERLGFVPTRKVSRDYEGRVVILTLSASLFILDRPDATGRRRYVYENIYGNFSIPAEGHCRLKGRVRVGKRLTTVEFSSSPIQLVASGQRDASSSFRDDSIVVQKSFQSTLSPIREEASRLASRFRHSSSSTPDSFLGADNTNPDASDTIPDESPDGEDSP